MLVFMSNNIVSSVVIVVTSEWRCLIQFRCSNFYKGLWEQKFMDGGPLIQQGNTLHQVPLCGISTHLHWRKNPYQVSPFGQEQGPLPTLQYWLFRVQTTSGFWGWSTETYRQDAEAAEGQRVWMHVFIRETIKSRDWGQDTAQTWMKQKLMPFRPQNINQRILRPDLQPKWTHVPGPTLKYDFEPAPKTWKHCSSDVPRMLIHWNQEYIVLLSNRLKDLGYFEGSHIVL